MKNLSFSPLILALGILFLISPSFSLFAQNGVERVVIVNGGKFGDPTENVNVQLYDPITGNVDIIDYIETSSVQEVILEGSTAYVAAQDSIIKYDLGSGQRLATAAFGAPSTAKLGFYEDYLIVGNWYGLSQGNLRIFNKEDLSFVDSIPEITKGVRDFVIVGDTAFVVQNFTNQFFGDSAGYISVVDLKRMRFVRDIALDPSDELGRLVHLQGTLYGINPNVETIAIYDIANGQVLPKRFTGVDMQMGPIGAQLLIHDNILYTKINDGIGSFDLINNQVITANLIDTFATAFAFDTINELFYLSQTDFATFMRGGIYNFNGNKTGAFSTGFSPEAIGIVYNELPVAQNDGGFTPKNQDLLLDVLANDEDDGLLSVALGSIMPTHGMVSIQGNQLQYEPDADFTGFDRFTYQAIDGWGHRDTAEIQIQVGSTSSPQGPGDYGLERIIFSTGGEFLGGGNKVTAYAYNPEKRELKDFAKILGDFSNTVAVERHFSYIHVGRASFSPHGPDVVIKYDMQDESAIDTAFNVSGTQQILFHDDFMILTRAFGADSNYVLIFDKNNLQAGPIFEDVDIPLEASGAVVLDQKLYVAYNQNDSARLAIYDLSGMMPQFERKVTLDTLAAPLGGLFTDGQQIYGLSEKVLYPPPTFSPVVVHAGVTIFDPSNDTWQTIATPNANGGVALQGDSLFANFGGGIGIFNLQSNSLDQQPIFPLSYTAAGREPRTGSFFFLETDYFSFGLLASSDSIGEFRFDLPTDISGSAIALAYNHAPIARPDYFAMLSAGVPVNAEVLLNDSETNGDSLRVEIVKQATRGTATVQGDQIIYTPTAALLDSVIYAAIDSWGRSDEATAYFGKGQSIEDELGLGEIKVFPIPAEKDLFVRFAELPVRSINISIYDLSGKKLVSSDFRQVAQVQLSLAHLAPAPYLLHITYEGKVWSKRFVKK